MTNEELIAELKSQRARIAGEGGWHWIKGHPHLQYECCALYYKEDRWNISTLSMEARRLIIVAIDARFDLHGNSVIAFNDEDSRCTKEFLLEIFDLVIEELQVMADADAERFNAGGMHNEARDYLEKRHR